MGARLESKQSYSNNVGLSWCKITQNMLDFCRKIVLLSSFKPSIPPAKALGGPIPNHWNQRK